MPDVSAKDNDVLDEGLSRLAVTGPEYRGGLSNHGPMAAEALVRLGRADAVERWLDGYLKRLDDAPRPGDKVTAPVVAYSALPVLPPRLAGPTYDALWHVGAALYAVHAGGVAPEPLPAAAPPSPADLTDRAVATGDEHAIKLTEACLRLHAEDPSPVYLHAAARASALLGRR